MLGGERKEDVDWGGRRGEGHAMGCKGSAKEMVDMQSRYDSTNRFAAS